MRKRLITLPHVQGIQKALAELGYNTPGNQEGIRFLDPTSGVEFKDKTQGVSLDDFTGKLQKFTDIPNATELPAEDVWLQVISKAGGAYQFFTAEQLAFAIGVGELDSYMEAQFAR